MRLIVSLVIFPLSLRLLGCSEDGTQFSPWKTNKRGTYATPKAPGIENSGLTCYFNSIWQSLSHSDRFMAVVSAFGQPVGDSPEARIVNESRSLLTEIRSGNRNQVKADRLLSALSVLNPGMFNIGQMQDAQEAMMDLIGSLSRAVDRALPGSPALTLFSFGISEGTECPGIDNSPASLATEVMLRVHFPPGPVDPVSLEAMMMSSFESMEVDSACPNGTVGMTKRNLLSTPDLLVVSPQRVRTRADNTTFKVQTKIDYPHELSFGNAEYTLVGIVHHL